MGASTKVNGKGRKVVGKDEKVAVAHDELEEQTPKPKKVKAKVRDEINLATKKMEYEIREDKSGDISMSSKLPLQLQVAGGGGRKLKREGAIADISLLYKKETPATSANPDQNISTGNNNDLMDIDNR